MPHTEQAQRRRLARARRAEGAVRRTLSPIRRTSGPANAVASARISRSLPSAGVATSARQPSSVPLCSNFGMSRACWCWNSTSSPTSRAEDLPRQHERLVMPAQAIDAAGNGGRCQVWMYSLRRSPGGLGRADLEAQAEQLGAHLVAAAGQQARRHRPFMHHLIGVGDPEQDAPVLGVGGAVEPDHLKQRADPRERGAAVRPGILEVDPGRAHRAVQVLYSRPHDHEGRLPADHPGGCRRDLVLALLGRALAPGFWIFSASALTPTPSSFAAARSA